MENEMSESTTTTTTTVSDQWETFSLLVGNDKWVTSVVKQADGLKLTYMMIVWAAPETATADEIFQRLPESLQVRFTTSWAKTVSQCKGIIRYCKANGNIDPTKWIGKYTSLKAADEARRSLEGKTVTPPTPPTPLERVDRFVKGIDEAAVLEQLILKAQLKLKALKAGK